MSLSLAETQLESLEPIEPGDPTSIMPWAIRLTGPVDVAALKQGLNEIVQRHNLLQIPFPATNGRPIKTMASELTVPLPVLDLADRTEAEREAQVLRLARENAVRPFHLDQAPLLRISLLRLGVEEHIMLLAMHRAISDDWSVKVFVQELAALHAAFSAGQSSPLSALEVQYSDFAQWQKERLQDQALEAQFAYWHDQLSGEPAMLDLPIDHPRPPIPSFRGATRWFCLPRYVAESARFHSRQEGATLFMTLLAALQALLHRYTGQDDIRVGALVSRRCRAEFERLIGRFANTVVLRTDCSGDPSFKVLLGRVREVVSEAYAHQDLPFEMLVERMPSSQDVRHIPPFQVMFVLQDSPLQALELSGVTWAPLEVDCGIARFDLTLSIEERADGLWGSLNYNTDLFDEATITRMLGHFQTLLEAGVADPGQRLSMLPLLTEPERHQLLVEWNDTRTDHATELCIHQLFEAQVEQTPDAIAVAFQDQCLTYGELNRRANQLAHHLQALGVGPEVLVGICMERSPELMVGIIGILKAGGAYVPLDVTYPKERLAFMLKDSQVQVLLVQEWLANVLPEHGARLVRLDTDWLAIAQRSEQNPVSRTGCDNLAYVIYTSGSTGQPKGVMIQHRSLVNYTVTASAKYGLDPRDRALQFASISFDASAEEIYPSLTRGATLVLRTDSMIDTVAGFLTRCSEWGLTVLNLPTAYWHEIAAGLDTQAEFPSVVRLVIIGGERAQPERWVDWEQHRGRKPRLVNSYGPTEATIVATMIEMSELAGSTRRREVPIGHPVHNVQAYVLDRRGQPVPVGVSGELHIGGVGLARGYLNRPDLTAERFIPDPFGKVSGARLYKTGDLARYLPDGNIEFIGRADQQVKVRGFRVELGEIEAVLGQHPALQEFIVVPLEDESGNKRLVVYVVPKAEQALAGNELRSFLKDKLPSYMLPSAFVFLDALPLTPAGKVDRRALPMPDRDHFGLQQASIAPRNPIEETLVGIWAAVLGLDQVGIHDSFFELGGHSLLATQVISRILQAFQVELPLRSLFEAPTIAGLAERIESARDAGQGLPSAPPIKPVARDGALLLSFAQQRLWFLDQLSPGSPAYNISSAARLTGPLCVVALEQSLNEMVRRHKALRTTFTTVDGQPVQVVASALSLRMPIVDVSELAETEREAEAQRLMTAELQQPFDLARGPLVRSTLVRLGKEEHVLLVTMHHIVSDGWSLGVFNRELGQLYAAFRAGQPSPLPELDIQYADYAHWQREWLQGQVLEAQLGYWKQQLDHLPTLELPTDRPRPAVQTFQGTRQSFALPATLTESLKALSRQEGVTLFMTLMAAFKTLLCRYTGQEDIAVGVPIANRNWAELEGLIGFFVNTLVLRTTLSGDPTFRVLLRRVREVTLGAYAHQDLPFEKLVQVLQPERDLSRNSLFQVSFVLQNVPADALSLPGLTVSPLELYNETAKFDLTLELWETQEGLCGQWEYSTDLLDGTTITRMTGHFRTLLEGIVADPDRRLSDLPLLTENERHQLLIAWNDTRADLDAQHKCFHQLFEAQVERTPEAVAVAFEEQVLTYQELNRRANRLAHYLQKQGVGPEVLVGICAERSLEMVVGLVGILKAGGAFVPFDPAYPRERLAWMLEDTRAPVLLTQRRLEERLPLQEAKCSPDLNVIYLDMDCRSIAQESDENPPSVVKPENLAYVIYTSGSTGKPKGVMILQRGLMNYLIWCQRAYPLEAGHGSPVHSSISFDLTITSLFSPLLVGQSVQLLPEDWGIETLSNALRQRDYSLVKITPAHLELLSHQLSPQEAAGQTRAFIIGGENLLAESIAFWQDYAPDTMLINEYGPTEAVVGCCTFQVPHRKCRTGSVPIGRPIVNTQLYILDQHCQPVPIGVPGELYIGGAGVARGYLNQPDLTASCFIADPFNLTPGSRLYKTGDLVRYHRDGNIEFLGRKDDQVKIRGFRIELGEIEAALGQHPAVREVVVVAREDNPGAKALVAYLVLKENTAPADGELRSLLREKLPDYMLPSAFVTLKALPLTANGKVDRRALPIPDRTRSRSQEDFVAPSTPVEEALAGIWSQVLQLEQISVHDNFFELGGHSLLATQVISRVSDEFLVKLQVRALFEAPTIAGLAVVVEQHLIEQVGAEKYRQIMAELDQLSEHEVQAMLLAEQTVEGNPNG